MSPNKWIGCGIAVLLVVLAIALLAFDGDRPRARSPHEEAAPTARTDSGTTVARRRAPPASRGVRSSGEPDDPPARSEPEPARTVSLYVTVHDTTGQPVADATVTAGEAGSATAEELGRTDASGTLAQPLVADVRELWIRAERSGLVGCGAAVVQLHGSEGSVEASVTLSSPASLRVVVRDEDAQPVPGAALEVRGADSLHGYRSWHDEHALLWRGATDAAGEATIAGLPCGVLLGVRAGGATGAPRAERVILLACDGDTQELMLLWAAQEQVALTVSDERAKRLAGVEIGLVPGPNVLRRTDEDGRAVLELEPGRAPARVWLFHRDKGLAWRDVAPGSELEVVLRPGLSLTGHVLDGRGRPVGAAGVMPIFLDADGAALGRLLATRLARAFGAAVLRTGDDGAFGVPCLPAGDVGLGIRPPESPTIDFGPWPAGTRELQLVLPAAADGATFDVLALDPDGRPLRGATVSVFRIVPARTAAGTGVSKRTDARGIARVAYPATGTFRVAVEADDLLPRTLADREYGPGLHRLEARLHAYASLELVLERRSGTAGSWLEVRAYDVEDRPVELLNVTDQGKTGGYASYSDATGRCVANRLAPGRVRLEVRRPRGDDVLGSVEVELTPGPNELRMTLDD